MKEYIILIVCFVVITSQSYSQSFSFSYDNAGNRIERAVYLSTKTEITNPDIVSDSSSDESVNEEENLEDLVSEQFLIYPNPTKGELTLKAGGDIYDSSYILFDITGKEVLKGEVRFNLTSINLSNEIPGIYSLQVNINGNLHYWKIVKE